MRHLRWGSLALAAILLIFTGLVPSRARATDTMDCAPVHAALGMARTICADVVALDQTLVYNRFGSFNPLGMIYALRRDVVAADLPPEAFSPLLLRRASGHRDRCRRGARGRRSAAQGLQAPAAAGAAGERR